MIYLDNHSTTRIDHRVLEAMMPYLTWEYGNPSSPHIMGEKPKQAVEQAREYVAELINVNPLNIYFTSSATEANNIVLKGHYYYLKSIGYDNIKYVSSAIEHSSIIKSLEFLKETSFWSFNYELINVNTNGSLKINEFDLYKQDANLISVMYANNEIGYINDIQTLFGNIDAHIFKHSDGTQIIGKQLIDLNAVNIDAFTFNGHKIHGPKGVGVLFLRNHEKIVPIISGGLQNGITSGTINVPAVVGMGEACRIIKTEFDSDIRTIKDNRDYLLEQLNKNFNIIVNGDLSSRLVNNLNVAFPSVPMEVLVKGLGDVAISGGSACNSILLEPSPVIKLINPDYKDNSVRFSVSKYTTRYEIDYAINKIKDIVSMFERK